MNSVRIEERISRTFTPHLFFVEMILTLLLLLMSLSLVHSDLKILSVPGGEPGPAPCARTCSGVGSHIQKGEYEWKHDDQGAKMTKTIDMSECEFVSAPVVTAVMRQEMRSLYLAIQIETVEPGKFTVATLEDIGLPYIMELFKCDVYWIATGFTC